MYFALDEPKENGDLPAEKHVFSVADGAQDTD